MKRKREFVDYLRDILDTIEKVEHFTEAMDFERFSTDDKTVFAVVQALEVIGEAAKKIPKAIQRQNPEIPWREMAGIRDKLIHEYFGMNLLVVWKTVVEDLSKLKPVISLMLEKAVAEGKYSTGNGV